MTGFIVIPAPPEDARLKARLKKLRRLGIRAAVLGRPGARSRGGDVALTPRQTQILRELASGLRTKEVARKLRVSIKTVETHRAALTHRLGIRSLPRLVRYALRAGVLPASWLLE